MKKLIFFAKKRGYLLAGLFFLILRLYGLNLSPVGIAHDEIHGLVGAKSIAITGTISPEMYAGIFTRGNTGIGIDTIFGELVAYLLVPWMRITPLSMFWSRIPFVFASLGIAYFTGRFFENLSGKKSVGQLVVLLLAINPWLFNFGRSMYETLFSYLFSFIGLFFFTKSGSGRKNLFLGLFFCFLGFLSYFGAKPLFPLLVIWGVLFNLVKNKFKNKKTGFLMICLSLILTVVYYFVLKNSPAGFRLGETNTISMETIQKQVDDQRRMSLEIPAIRDLLINKYVVSFKLLLERYLNVFSLNYFFLRGQLGFDNFMIADHSFMYLQDLPLVVFGLFAVGASVLNAVFLLILMVIAPLPVILSKFGGTYYALRIGLVFPLLAGLCSWGIIWFLSKIHKGKLVFLSTLILLYLFSFINFWVMYWYRTPFELNTGWYFPERALIKYLVLAEKETDKEIIIVTPERESHLLYYLAFYGQKYETKEQIVQINNAMKNKSYQVGKIKFTQECPLVTDQKGIFVFQGSVCPGFSADLPRIAATRDSGQRFLILNETVCQGLKLNRYPYPRKITQFSVEKMSKEEFCLNWITKP